jgi:hypothetical protein
MNALCWLAGKIKNIMLHHLRELRVTIRLPLLFILGRVSCNFANAAHCYLLDFVNFALYHFQPISTRHSFHLMSKYVNTKNVSQNYSVLFWRSLVAKLTHVHFIAKWQLTLPSMKRRGSRIVTLNSRRWCNMIFLIL